ncbi:hypothetical protein BYT27DRAFT_7114831, partial [Phlegmacium glaucopus]
MKGVPQKYTKWISDKTTGRETIITFDDYISPPFEVKNGLDQGCNLSPFCYNYYSADQMKAIREGGKEMASTYADDGVCAARASTLREAGEMITEMFNRREGPKEWGRTHHSMYEYHKMAGIAATRRRIQDPMDASKRVKQGPLTVRLDDQHTIITKSSYKFLGVIIDSELRFKEQVAQAIGHGTKWTNQVRRLSKNARGIKGSLT